MKHISIIVPEGGALSGIEISRHVFTEMNDYFESSGRNPLFSIQLVGASDMCELNNGLFKIKTDVTYRNLKKTDLIIIPALHADVGGNLDKNKELIDWISVQHAGGAEVASLCIGAFLLARTGLLNGKKCTTHWKAADVFREMFPEVILVKDKIITEEQGIYSSGGGLSFMNLIVYLIEKYAGKDAAIYCAKFFQIDMERSAQLPFMIFQGQKNHSDVPVRKAQEYIERHFQQRITVDQLAEMLAVGRRSLERRFKKATANTIYEYIMRVKIESAKKLLEQSNKKINEIMSEVGYADTKTFRTSFKMITGMLPNEYRNRYNKEVTA